MQREKLHQLEQERLNLLSGLGKIKSLLKRTTPAKGTPKIGNTREQLEQRKREFEEKQKKEQERLMKRERGIAKNEEGRKKKEKGRENA